MVGVWPEAEISWQLYFLQMGIEGGRMGLSEKCRRVVSWEVRVCLEDMHAYMFVHHMHTWCLWKAEQALDPRKYRQLVSYGYWTLNWVLYKSNTCSLPLGHILTPIFPFWNLEVFCYLLVGWPCYDIYARQADVCLLYLLQELRAAPSQRVWMAQLNKSHSLSLD